jgi:hypothetical protein
VDVSLAPQLGRLCALLEMISADYRLSFVKVQTLITSFKTAIYLSPAPASIMPSKVRPAETQSLLLTADTAITGLRTYLSLLY